MRVPNSWASNLRVKIRGAVLAVARKGPGLIKRSRWLVLLLALLMIGGALTPNAAAQESRPATLTIVAPALNVRSGPGLTHPPIDFLLQGEQVPIIGYDAASDWWQVRLSEGTSGWVSGGAEYVSVSGDPASVTGSQLPAPVNKNPSAHTFVFQSASGGPIYAINPDGTNLRYLTTGLDPALSPDGQWVTFARWETSQDGALGSLWLIKVDGSGERMLMTNVHNPRTPVWSSDGTQIALSFQHGGRVESIEVCRGKGRAPSGALDVEVGLDDEGDIEVCYTLPPDPYWGLRVVDVATGTHEDLPGENYSLSPAWDPANPARLIFNGDRSLINLDLNQEIRWPLAGNFNDHSPVFSPDGSKIALTHRQDDHWEIHVMNADGSGRVRLTETSYLTLVQQQLNGETPHSHNNAAPTWSPDGTQIAFLTDRTGPWEIWVMNADGSNQRPMFPAGTLAGIPLQYHGTDEQALAWR